MNAHTPIVPELDLITVPAESAFDVFSALDTSKVDAILDQVRAHVDAFLPTRDLSTKTSRQEIASFAYKVSRAKTAIETVGKEVAADAKEIPKRIDANRKHVKDTLDAWRDEVRKPLDDWEAAEQSRIDIHAARIEEIVAAGRLPHGICADGIAEVIAIVESVEIGPACEEYEENYTRAKESTLATLRPALELTRRQEAQAAELEKLRAAQAERDRIDAEQKAAREAADKAREDERRRADEEIAARQRAAEAELAAVQARAQAEQDAARNREIAAQQAQEEAERRAAQAELDGQAAAQRERDLIAAEQAAIQAETDRRTADLDHKATVHRAALAAFLAAGLNEDAARNAIVAIVKGQIPNVTITY